MAQHGAHVRSDLNRLAFSATNHCLTGCVIGEVTGMAIATALGWGDLASIGLAVALAFVFGYSLTMVPLLRGGLALGAAVGIALTADTISISIMEAIDNLFVWMVPGAMEAGLSEALFWWPILTGFAIAYPFAFLAQRWLIARGKGHAHGHH